MTKAKLFKEEWNHHFNVSLWESGIPAIQTVLEEVYPETGLSVLQAFSLLRTLNREDSFTEEIKYSLCSGLSDAIENYIGEELESMGLLNLEQWFAEGSCEAEGSVKYDESVDEWHCYLRIKTYSRLCPDLGEKSLADLEQLQLDLDYLVAHAANELRDRSTDPSYHTRGFIEDMYGIVTPI